MADAHEDEVDEVDLLAWPDPLPASWQLARQSPLAGWEAVYDVSEDGVARGSVRVARVLDTEYAPTYPVSGHDRLLEPSDDAAPEALQLASEQTFADDPRCRRLVVAVPEEDLEQIERAEKAGYRYVVDVDLPDRAVSLLAAEPEWVLEQSRGIDIVPTD